MNLNEEIFDIPTEHMANVFGGCDKNIKKIERALHVTIAVREGGMKILGEAANVKSASRVFMVLVNLSKRGNEITEQQVDYALDLAAKQENVGVMSEMDDDLICHTTAGKPIKPKTLGQKAYVDAIRKQMVVFGIGPAGNRKDLSCNGDGNYWHLKMKK